MASKYRQHLLSNAVTNTGTNTRPLKITETKTAQKLYGTSQKNTIAYLAVTATTVCVSGIQFKTVSKHPASSLMTRLVYLH